MKKVRITVKKIAHYDDLIEQYENPLEHACSMELGRLLYAMVGKSLKVFAQVPGIRCRHL